MEADWKDTVKCTGGPALEQIGCGAFLCVADQAQRRDTEGGARRAPPPTREEAGESVSKNALNILELPKLAAVIMQEPN